MIRLMNILPKVLTLREEDYWLVPVRALVAIFIAVAIYSSTVPFRAPSVVLAVLGLWFTTSKINSGYSRKNAYANLILTLGAGVLLFAFLFALTN